MDEPHVIRPMVRDPGIRMVRVYLEPAEFEAIEAIADKAGSTEGEVVRTILRTMFALAQETVTQGTRTAPRRSRR